MVFLKTINAKQLKLQCFSKFKFQFNTHFEKKNKEQIYLKINTIDISKIN